ncbi:hypothetical protein PINS_up006239 [Pythium insidiosum]|nr:hypothetical protein PINS_up006239 [Pythium insidiosum]
MALALLWWVLSGVVCALTTLTAVAYRRRWALGWGASSDDDDDDDGDDDDDDDGEDDEPEIEVARTRKEAAEGEKVALIDAAISIAPSTWGRNALLALFGRSPSPPTRSKPKASRRRHTAAPKVHKSFFYPVLDESLLWYAQWELSHKRHVAPSSSSTTASATPPESASTDSRQLDIRIEDATSVELVSLSPPRAPPSSSPKAMAVAPILTL